MHNDIYRTRRPIVARPRATGPGQKSRAQSLVEFALISPLLFAIIFGIIEFGWLFNNHMSIHYATREGARVGAVAAQDSNADTQIQTVIHEATAQLVYHDPMHLSIYKAETDGLCGSPCIEDTYDWTGSSWVDTNSPNPWPFDQRKNVEPTDVIGVEIRYNHYFFIGFLPGTDHPVEIRDHSIIPIEPAYFAPP